VSWRRAITVSRRTKGGCDECCINDEKGRQLWALLEGRGLCVFFGKKGETKTKRKRMEGDDEW
jgi:hypothetical protein